MEINDFYMCTNQKSHMSYTEYTFEQNAFEFN